MPASAATDEGEKDGKPVLKEESSITTRKGEEREEEEQGCQLFGP